MYKNIIIGFIIFVAGILFSYKVLFPLTDYFNEPGLPVLEADRKISDNKIVACYQYWSAKKSNMYDEEKAISFVKNDIIRETHDQRILDIYDNMKKDQNITIIKNMKNNNIYIFTNSQDHISKLAVYTDDGKDLNLSKTFIISHPTYRVGHANYDEANHKVYLGVIRKNWTEGNFGGWWISGVTAIDVGE